MVMSTVCMGAFLVRGSWLGGEVAGEFGTKAFGDGGRNKAAGRGAGEARCRAEIGNQFFIIVGDGFGFDADGALGFALHI